MCTICVYSGYGHHDNRNQGHQSGGQGYRGQGHNQGNRGGNQDRNYNQNRNRGNRGGYNQNYRGGYNRGGYYWLTGELWDRLNTYAQPDLDLDLLVF